jgi:hypothetical protein
MANEAAIADIEDGNGDEVGHRCVHFALMIVMDPWSKYATRRRHVFREEAAAT